jgi:hypothetical protein
MKLGKFTTSKASGALGTAVGVGAGMLLSNGLKSVIPVNNETAVKGIVAAAGVAGMILISGNDTISKIAKNVAIGAAVQQTTSLAKEFATPHLPSGNGKVAKFINASFENDTVIPVVASSQVKRLANPMRMASPNSESYAHISERIIGGGGFQTV